jgi:hypothetical protein
MSDSSELAIARPRYGDRPLPPYSYVPGFTPHPMSDPRGHMHGASHESPAPLDPSAWRDSATYLYAIDLFNHGFYWEAHEAWESLWHAAGRQGPIAAWLKALIKLAAAGVKAREGNPSGVGRHAQRALELLAEVRATLPPHDMRYCGVSLESVEREALSTASSADQFTAPNPARLFPFGLTLGEPQRGDGQSPEARAPG